MACIFENGVKINVKYTSKQCDDKCRLAKNCMLSMMVVVTLSGEENKAGVRFHMKTNQEHAAINGFCIRRMGYGRQNLVGENPKRF